MKLVKHLETQINGFNSTKLYTHDDKSIVVHAVYVPNISRGLRIQGPKNLVLDFISNGIAVAEKTLLDYNEFESIINIEMIWVANCGYLFNESDCVFKRVFFLIHS